MSLQIVKPENPISPAVQEVVKETIKEEGLSGMELLVNAAVGISIGWFALGLILNNAVGQILLSVVVFVLLTAAGVHKQKSL